MRNLLFLCFFLPCAVIFSQEGAPDPTFGQSGRVLIGFEGNLPLHDPTAVAVQSDGKIVVTGLAFHVPGTTIPHVGVARLLPNGSLDPTFSGDGKAGFLIDNSVSNNVPRTIRVLSDGKLLLFVTATTRYYFLRLLPNGDPDPSFGTNGVMKIFSTLEANAGFTTNFGMEVQANGKIILSYRIKYTGINSAAHIVSRFNQNGSPDLTFAGTGRLAVDSSSLSNGLTGPIENVQMSLVAGNKILLGGDTVLQGSPFVARIKLIQLAVNGTFDQAFGANGQLKLPNIQLAANAMLVDPFQNIFLAGMQGGVNAVVKIKPNGTLDTNYGNAGVATGGSNFVMVNNCLSFSKGNVIIAGVSNATGAFQAQCKSFDSLGNLNTSFGLDGVASVPQIGDENILRAMVIQPDGKLVIACKRKNDSDVEVSDFEVIRLNAAASPVVEVVGGSEVAIWPNPVNETLNVSVNPCIAGTTLDLYATNGVLLQSMRACAGEQSMELRAIPAGVYFLQVNEPGKKPLLKVIEHH